jgi:hypothetical protein
MAGDVADHCIQVRALGIQIRAGVVFGGTPHALPFEAGRIIESPAEMAKLILLFDLLRAAALSPAESVRLITAIRGEYDE